MLLQWWAKHCQNSRNLKENDTEDLIYRWLNLNKFFFFKTTTTDGAAWKKKLFRKGMDYFLGLEVGKFGLQWLLLQVLQFSLYVIVLEKFLHGPQCPHL